jgi:sugar transferase (PEP-CTERM/EpsH1 system associated)
MDFCDMDSAKFADYSGAGPMRWVHAREAEKLQAFERATAARADASLFVSNAERQLFTSRIALPGRDVRAISNGIDLAFYDPLADFPRSGTPETPLLVFTGQMDYRPNVEAVAGFADEVLPILLRRHPDLRFAIVGRNPTPAVQRLSERPGIIVTGSVPDVRTWLAAASIVVAPLRIARGIQNKVLEAMAMARPVVASAGAFEGIEAVHGRDLIVADSAEEQAAAILSLLANPDAAAALGTAARRQMEARYHWQATLAPLTELLTQPVHRAAA